MGEKFKYDSMYWFAYYQTLIFLSRFFIIYFNYLN